MNTLRTTSVLIAFIPALSAARCAPFLLKPSGERS